MNWSLTPDAFDRLLAWLHTDRDQAGVVYERIRARLIRIFTSRGCNSPEELADETFNRVARNLGQIAESYIGDPALYFYGVARKVFQEYTRRRIVALTEPFEQGDSADSAELDCLDQCIQRLPVGSRALILQYYGHTGRMRIIKRQELAVSLGLGLNALRIRALRIRATLRKCVESCIQLSGQ